MDNRFYTRYFADCVGCGNKFKKLKKSSTICFGCNTGGSDYDTERKRLIAVHEYNKRQTKYDDVSLIDGYDYLICGECGAKCGDLGPHIMHVHNMDIDDYKHKYKISSIKCQKIRDNVLGDKNPAYQHGGKLSPFSIKFINPHNKDYSDLSYIAAKTRKDNGNDSTCIGYWLKKTDGDVGMAKELLSDRQSTFSLKKCIEKHGDVNGFVVWKNRQEKWQESVNDRPQAEIDAINKKKSNSLSYVNLWTNKSIGNGIFYLLELPNGFYKIGITSKSVKERNSRNGDYTTIIEIVSHISHCFQTEQLLKQVFFKDNIISKMEMVGNFGWTETLKNVDLDVLINKINELMGDKVKTTIIFKESFKLNYEDNF